MRKYKLDIFMIVDVLHRLEVIDPKVAKEWQLVILRKYEISGVRR